MASIITFFRQQGLKLPSKEESTKAETTSVEIVVEATTKEQASVEMMTVEATTTKEQAKVPVIGVFWDIENCSVPQGKSAHKVCEKIRSMPFYADHRELEFSVVCDVFKEREDVINDLNLAQVNVLHVSSKCKNAADKKLHQLMRRFVEFQTEKKLTLVLISGDQDFLSDILDFRHRHGVEIILLHLKNAIDALISAANFHYDFHEMLENVPSSNPVNNPPASFRFTELLITGLPESQPSGIIRAKLTELLKSCQGKIRRLNDESGTAVLKFDNGDKADRCKAYLQNEKILGKEITVTYNRFGRFRSHSESPIQQPPRSPVLQRVTPFRRNRNSSRDLGNNEGRQQQPQQLQHQQQQQHPARKRWRSKSRCWERNGNNANGSEVTTLTRNLSVLTLPPERFLRIKNVPRKEEGFIKSLFKSNNFEYNKLEWKQNGELWVEAYSSVKDAQEIVDRLKNSKIDVELIFEDEPMITMKENNLTINFIFPIVKTTLNNLRLRLRLVFQGKEYLPLESLISNLNSSLVSDPKFLIRKSKDGGVRLEQLLSALNSTEIAVRKDSMMVLIKKKKPRGSFSLKKKTKKLLNFESELLQILEVVPRIKINNDLPEAYLKSLKKNMSTSSKAYDLGGETEKDIFECLRHISEDLLIVGTGSARELTRSFPCQKRIFWLHLRKMLGAQPYGEFKLSDFEAVYSKVLGKSFEISDFGICHLDEMISSINDGSEDETKKCVVSNSMVSFSPEMKAFVSNAIQILSEKLPNYSCSIEAFDRSYLAAFEEYSIPELHFKDIIELFEDCQYFFEISRGGGGENERGIRLSLSQDLKLDQAKKNLLTANLAIPILITKRYI